MYRIVFSHGAQKDYAYRVKSGNASTIKKIRVLLTEISEHPFTGTGKPEPLKHDLAGMWSRRINTEHRTVYRVNDDGIEVYILSMRRHYS